MISSTQLSESNLCFYKLNSDIYNSLMLKLNEYSKGQPGIYSNISFICADSISIDELLNLSTRLFILKNHNDLISPQHCESTEFTETKSVMPNQSETSNNPNSTIKRDISQDLRTKKILSIMKYENYISGESAASEEYVESLIKTDGMAPTLNWLMELYLYTYDDPHTLIGILHMLSHFDYESVSPQGPIMALALLQHKSQSVREFAIKAFENWGSKDAVDYLKQIKCDQSWLQQYLDGVIEDLENI